MNRNHIGQKINKAKTLIEAALKKNKNPVVACSFGKDSMVVLHMVRQFDSDVPVMFNNTLVEYPDTYRFKNLMRKKWKLNIIETKPSKTFWWIVENYGFPLYTRKGHKDASKNCCRYLKEYPIAKILRKYKFDLYFTGLSRHESRLREFSAKKYGTIFIQRHKNTGNVIPFKTGLRKMYGITTICIISLTMEYMTRYLRTASFFVQDVGAVQFQLNMEKQNF